MSTSDRAGTPPELICVTARALCDEPFAQRLERLVASPYAPAAVILREKDLDPDDYRVLATETLRLCRRHGVRCILHTFAEVALELRPDALHLPLPALRGLDAGVRRRLPPLGASCHSVADIEEASALGCAYVTAGHIFDTDCKRGLPGRGLEFLARACAASPVPVYAIGGITPERLPAVLAAGAWGACVMGALMRCQDPDALLRQFCPQKESPQKKSPQKTQSIQKKK